MGLENREIIIKGKGIKVSVLSSIFIALGVVIMIASICVIKKIYTMFDAMMDAYQFEETESEAAESFRIASDYLTEQARLFVATGDIKNAENYFEEKDELQNRQAALSVVENSHILDIESNLLSNAMDLSEALVDYEVHAMKLTAKANKIDDAKMPGEVAAYELPKEELELDESELLNLAIHLVYSDEYEDYKSRIDWDVENAVTLIKDEAGTRYREDESDLIMTLNITVLLIFIMFVLLMLIFIFNTLLVVRPAKKFVELLDKHEKLPEIGGYEFRDFARTYNDIYRSNKKNRELLREQGEVDELTGTLKVGTLEIVRHNLSQHKEPMGIMMIDIDNFRSIKEASGYEMADKVVAKVANLFVSSFKSSDYIIRTSQDEFIMFLLRMQQSDSEMLKDRILKINEALKNSEDGVVEASVSVGAAFAENGYTEETERKADMALNYVKKNGRGTCKIDGIED